MADDDNDQKEEGSARPTAAVLNVLSRPKRSVHFKKLYIPPELMRSAAAGEATSSSDEDFVPGAKKQRRLKEEADEAGESAPSESDDGESDEDDSESGDSGSDGEEEDSAETGSSEEEASEEDQPAETSTAALLVGAGDADDDESDDEDFEVGEDEMDESENSDDSDDEDDSEAGSQAEDTKEPVKKSKKEEKKQNGGQEVQPKRRGRPKSDATASGEKKPKKPRKPRKKVKKNASDDETEQFLSHFKSPIVKGLKKAKREPGSAASSRSAAAAPQVPQTSGELVERVNTGPHVRGSEVVVAESGGLSFSYTSYKVNQNLRSGEQSEAGGENGRGGLPRDKAPAVKDQDKPWECAFCAGADDKQGGLFGPYRVSLDYEVDMNHENALLDLFDEDKSERQNFAELWLHANCAIWSPSIIVKNNSVYGVAAAVKSARNMMCASCHRTGASLKCKSEKCKRAFHYDCALSENCSLNRRDFSVSCDKCAPTKKAPKLVKHSSKSP